jgi:hypothetical protein
MLCSHVVALTGVTVEVVERGVEGPRRIGGCGRSLLASGFVLPRDGELPWAGANRLKDIAREVEDRLVRRILRFAQ